MTLSQSLLLGAGQGLTEFLPVSSSGHLALAQHFMVGFHQPGILFDVMLHLGTLLAVVVYFRKDLLALAIAPWQRGEEGAANRHLLGLLVAGSLPTAVIGLLLKRTVEQFLEKPAGVAALLLVTGTLLFVAERFRHRGKRQKLTLVDALLTGVAQGVAVFPGISRSGATIATLLLRGVDGADAARFSFLLSLPAVCGAALLSLKDLSGIATEEIPLYLAGAAVASLVGFMAIHWLLAAIRKERLYAFAIYCWIVGSLTLLTLSWKSI